MRTTTVKSPTTKRKNAAYNRFAIIDTENKIERKQRDGEPNKRNSISGNDIKKTVKNAEYQDGD
jgi:hypothetical protein